MTILNRINRMVLEHGRVVNDSILSVDTLLNHRIDYAFSAYCGDALAHLVKGQPVDVILTAEASGISVAVFMAIVLNNEQWPHPAAVVFAKKSRPVTLAEDGFYVVNSYSRTKERPVQLFLGKHVIAPGARAFIVDDFMARGTTMAALGGQRDEIAVAERVVALREGPLEQWRKAGERAAKATKEEDAEAKLALYNEARQAYRSCGDGLKPILSEAPKLRARAILVEGEAQELALEAIAKICLKEAQALDKVVSGLEKAAKLAAAAKAKAEAAKAKAEAAKAKAEAAKEKRKKK